MTTTEFNRAEFQARAQLESLIEMVAALNTQDDDFVQDEARQAIHDDPLSVEVRSGWTIPGAPLEPAEYCILLCTGGPAVRIIGELDHHQQPEDARLEYQDWAPPWTAYPTTSEDDAALLEYAGQFYFGS